jgi:hypothetical protein
VSGSYVGNGAGGRRITGLGFRPDLVLVKGDDNAAGSEVLTSAVMRTSTMGPGDVSKPVIATCCNPATAASPIVANQITSIDAGGFTLGSDRRVAQSGVTFYWAAFKANANMKVGKYTGDGAASHVIVGLGFSPELVIVLLENAGRAIQTCSATPAGRSHEFDVGAWLSNQIHAGGSAEGAGAGVVAAFSPSGLSLDGPAHEYHRALVSELVSGGHARLGDAILAAQRDYAETGLLPELLEVYQLLGDPAMRLRP